MELGQEIQHFSLISSLGKGGMGEVFLALDNRLGRNVALKFLSADLCAQPDHVNRFIREARAASSLNHPNVCTIHEINDSGPRPFIAMEFIEGETLAQMIVRSRRGVYQTIEVALQVADALAEAHKNGLIHRDIKPANIIVSPTGRVKLLDFGLAKQVDRKHAGSEELSITRDGMIVGTASYMSPEQTRGLDVDERTDVWSLGVTMYEMLTGIHPFAGETLADTLASILTQEPIPIKRIVPGLPKALEDLVSHCLKKKIDERLASCSDLQARLRLLESELDIVETFDTIHGSVKRDDPTVAFEHATTEVALEKVTGKEIRKRNLRPNNLPERYDPILGRDKEISEVVALLRDDRVRLVTLTGIGGTGKTRLAEAVAENMLVDFEDGVFLVELGAITQKELIIQQIAGSLGIEDHGGKALDKLLSEHLNGKNILLVLDNFEQIVNGAAELTSLFDSSDRLKMLVTSRVLLNLSVEREYTVPPLELPSGSQSTDVLSSNPAIRLFVDRASTVRPTFELTEKNVEMVRAICSRLEGLPLAIELAAARMRVLSPAAIHEKLDDSLRLLAGGAGDIPERHRTMRGMVKWSYDLLSEPERSMFIQLSVFRGGFRFEAAEAVCMTDGNGGPEAFELLASFADKSLLYKKETASGELRFHILEVVREFAAEELQATGREFEAGKHHAEYFTQFAELMEPRIQAGDADVFPVLEEDHDNFRSAIRWSLDNDPALAVRLVVALRNFWILHGHLNEGFAWLADASDVGDPPADLRFTLMNGLGLAARFRGDHDAARKAYVAGLAAGEEAGDKTGIAISSRGLGLVLMQSGDIEAARSHFERGLEISRELEDDLGIAMSLSFLGDLYRSAGDYSAAAQPIESSVEIFRKIGRRAALADALNNLGSVLIVQNNFTKGKACFSEAFEIAHNLGNKITISHSLDGFAAIALHNGDLAACARLSGAADAMRESVGYKIEPAEMRFRDSYFEKLRKKLSASELSDETEKGRQVELAALAEMVSGSRNTIKPSEDVITA